MRRDAQVAHAGIGRQHDGERGWLAPGAGPLIQEMGDGRRAHRSTRERVAERRVERRRTVLIEEPQQGGGVGGQRLAAPGQGVEEGLGLGAERTEAITAAQLVGAAFLPGEGGEVRRLLDLLAAIVAPPVAGDLSDAIEHADEGFTDHERERAPDEGVGDRVVIAIEAQVRRLAGHGGPDELTREGVRRQRQQAGLLRRQGLAHELVVPAAGERAGVGDLGDPARELRVEILQRAEATGREEGVAEVLDHPLDLALLVAAVRGARLGREVIVAGQLEQPTEVELAFELMPCNALRLAQEPLARLPHPCSYFRKWGTYHSYDYETAGAPPDKKIVQLTQYEGRGPLVPEMLSGCRKAPIMAVGINPNLPGWWAASRNSINPLFDDFRQYAHYFRYRSTAKLDIPPDDYRKFGGGPQDTPLSRFELKVPPDAKGFRTIPVELQPVAMYYNYQSLLDDLAKTMGWSGHALSVGEDVSYGNMVACPSAKWITKQDPNDPSMPPMTPTEQAGIVRECFHHRRYFLRQLFQSLPAVLMIFSQSTTDAFLGEMQGRFSEVDIKVGDKIDDLMNKRVRLRFGADGAGHLLEARIIFAPHITGDPAHFKEARQKVLEQLVEEAKSRHLTYNPATKHLARPLGGCIFCTHLQIGSCDYKDELSLLAGPPSISAEGPVPEKHVQESLLSAFIATAEGAPQDHAARTQPPLEPKPAPPPGRNATPAPRKATTITAPAINGWALSGEPLRQPDRRAAATSLPPAHGVRSVE